MVRLRPATPLSVLLLAAFALLLVSVLSVPITQLIPLGKFKNVSFGVFGYCKDDGSCSPIGIGYDTGIASPRPPVALAAAWLTALHRKTPRQ